MNYNIKAFIECSTLDWPDRTASVIFLPKCNLQCVYCQNLKLITEYEIMPTIKFDSIKDKLIGNQHWIDSVVITGGEPLFNYNIAELLMDLKDLDLNIKIDTNGCFPNVLKDLIERNLIDFVAIDFKVPLFMNLYKRICGHDVDSLVFKSLKILKFSGIDYCIRTTVVPSIHTEDILITMKKQLNLKTVMDGQEGFWKLQNYQTLNDYNEFFIENRPFTQEEFEQRISCVI